MALQESTNPWQPIGRIALGSWLAFYAAFLLHALADADGFLLLDHVNLIAHEAGHFLFGWFGYTLGILGGTLGELLVPGLLAWHFAVRRDAAATAFCGFWFFENFLYIGRYMADARTVSLPLVGSGEHDWEILFGQWNLLVYDRTIGGATRAVGWLGMLASIAWLLWVFRATRQQST